MKLRLSRMRYFALPFFLLVLFATDSSAIELRALLWGYSTTDVNVEKHYKDVISEVDYSSDYTFGGGVEILTAAEFDHFMYGLGTGFITAQKKSSNEITPGAIPLWASFILGDIDDSWYVSPYLNARLGWIMAGTTEGCWWEKPLNLFASLGIGANLPYHTGIEFNYTYMTMHKSYEYKKLEYGLSSGRFGLVIHVDFNLTHDKIYTPNKGIPEDFED